MNLTIHGLQEQPVCCYNVPAVPEIGEPLVHQILEKMREYRVARRVWVAEGPASRAGLPAVYETMLDVEIWVEELTS